MVDKPDRRQAADATGSDDDCLRGSPRARPQPCDDEVRPEAAGREHIPVAIGIGLNIAYVAAEAGWVTPLMSVISRATAAALPTSVWMRM